MSDNQELYSYLFAVRISLQDTYENESDIIRELKLYLLETGHGTSNVNQILHGFYQNYGIDISIDTISQVPITNNNMLNNMLGFMLNQDDFDNSDEYDEENDPDEEDDSNEQDESDNGDESENINIPSIANTLMNQIPLMNPNNQESGGPSGMSFHLISSNGQTFTFNTSNLGQPNPILNQPNSILNQPNPILNQLNHLLSQPNPILNHGPTHQSMTNFLNAIMTGLNGQPNHNNLFQDVVVSTDESDLDKLKTVTLTSKMDSDCSICMGSMDKEETVTELNCTHTFHKDCILPYLKQYNYKCPVCRAEVGKTKYNM